MTGDNSHIEEAWPMDGVRKLRAVNESALPPVALAALALLQQPVHHR